MLTKLKLQWINDKYLYINSFKVTIIDPLNVNINDTFFFVCFLNFILFIFYTAGSY